MLTIIMIAENDFEVATEGGTFETVLGGTFKPMPSKRPIVRGRKDTNSNPFAQISIYNNLRFKYFKEQIWSV